MKRKVTGRLDQFTRPKTKSKPFSYSVMTFSAANEALESVYWKPEISYVIKSIQALNEIKYISFRLNMLKSKINPRSLKPIAIEDDRTQCFTTVLRDVAYIIDFDIVVKSYAIEPGVDAIAKHSSILFRRVKNGQHFKHPYLGCKEYVANITLPDGTEQPHESLLGYQDMGLMPDKIQYVPTPKGNIFWKDKDNWVKGVAVPDFKPFKMVDGLLQRV